MTSTAAETERAVNQVDKDDLDNVRDLLQRKAESERVSVPVPNLREWVCEGETFDVNAKGDGGRTALMMARYYGHFLVVREL